MYRLTDLSHTPSHMEGIAPVRSNSSERYRHVIRGRQTLWGGTRNTPMLLIGHGRTGVGTQRNSNSLRLQLGLPWIRGNAVHRLAPARIAALESVAQALHDEYESWLSAVPEALQGGLVYDKLTETVEALSTILELIEKLDPPRGLGRD